ncbi:MAG: glycosyltransferase, partial [Anaerolineae bacterium]|nr:glycosyltransferase [Anaerolineae bacterium]
MSRLLIVSHDVIGERMAGVGIRYYEIARTLARDSALQVILAAPTGSTLPASISDFGGRFVTYSTQDVSTLDGVICDCDVLLAYPDIIWQCRATLERLNKPAVVDGYDITLLEHLERDANRVPSDEKLRWHADYWRMMQYVLERGDFFVVATERQRDWWLGALAASGRINPLTYQTGPSLRQLVDLLPYGLPQQEPVHTRPVMRGVIEGINPDDKIVLWGGGCWEWLDPLTLIHAAAQIVPQRPDVKIVFPGLSHPARDRVPDMAIQQRTVDLARQLGLFGRNVFIGEWVPYEDWQNYLLESDVGVSLHRDHLEARFSARTRILSYIWAGLPMVLTCGDELAERVAQAGAAVLVEEQNPAAVAAAILGLLDHPRQHRSIAWDELRRSLSWSQAVQSLRRFCARPARAPDAAWRRSLSAPQPAHSSPVASADNPAQASMNLEPISPHLPLLAELPELRLPAPTTFIGRLLASFLDRLIFWRFIPMIRQQNQINRSVLQSLAALQNDIQAQREHTQAAIEDLAKWQRW